MAQRRQVEELEIHCLLNAAGPHSFSPGKSPHLQRALVYDTLK
jgi:hypothetical protein